MRIPSHIHPLMVRLLENMTNTQIATQIIENKE